MKPRVLFNLPSPEQGGYILFVSTIEPRKNLPTLLEAYRCSSTEDGYRPRLYWQSREKKVGSTSKYTPGWTS